MSESPATATASTTRGPEVERRKEKVENAPAPHGPGWRTSEFWLLVALNVATVLFASADLLPPKWAAFTLVVANSIYTLSRTALKSMALLTGGGLESIEMPALPPIIAGPDANGQARSAAADLVHGVNMSGPSPAPVDWGDPAVKAQLRALLATEDPHALDQVPVSGLNQVSPAGLNEASHNPPGLALCLLLSLSLFLDACTIIPTPHGTAQLWGDYTRVSLVDGPVRFSADSALHSPIVRAHWHGGNNLAASVVSGAIGLKGSNEVVGGLTSVIPAVVNRPTTRTPAQPAQ